MPSRPYQSKVLRFVLRQWQQGLTRQDRAWRQLQSTATWGTQVAVLPIYAILRSVERARFTLSSGSQQSQSTDTSITAKRHITDLDHSLTAILSHTQQLLAPKQMEQLAIRPKPGRKAQSFLSRGLPQIVKRLSARLFKERSTAVAHGTDLKQHGQLSPRREQGITTSRSAGIDRQETSALLQHGTTLASSLKNRHLILVNAKNETFDILTPEQQIDLKHYIACIMNAYQRSRTLARRQTKQLSVKTVLAISAVFVRSLPAEFSKAWLQVAPTTAPTLPPVNSPQPRSRILYPNSSSVRTVKARQLTARESTYQLPSRSPDAFEARVNDTRYLEHPLEKILRLIDRVLTWCENRWQQWRRA